MNQVNRWLFNMFSINTIYSKYASCVVENLSNVQLKIL